MGHTLVPSRDVRKDFGVGGPLVSRNPDVFIVRAKRISRLRAATSQGFVPGRESERLQAV